MTAQHLTRTAHDALRAQLDRLVTHDLVHAQQRLGAIQEAGDPEGLESTAAVYEVQQIQGQIDRLTRSLDGAVVIEVDGHDQVELGAIVTVDLGDGPERYRIDTHGAGDCLSPSSPIGAAIVGLRAGERVAVQTPGGALTVHVLAVE